jgi:hypothetical protein
MGSKIDVFLKKRKDRHGRCNEISGRFSKKEASWYVHRYYVVHTQPKLWSEIENGVVSVSIM